MFYPQPIEDGIYNYTPKCHLLGSESSPPSLLGLSPLALHLEFVVFFDKTGPLIRRRYLPSSHTKRAQDMGPIAKETHRQFFIMIRASVLFTNSQEERLA